MSEKNIDYITYNLNLLFPDANCELNYRNIFELSVAVILSAQTTDKRVNVVTELLFAKYRTINELANASYDDVLIIIKSLGLASTKAKNIINFAKCLEEKYHNTIPSTIDELVKLPGIGSKTANVIVSEGYHLAGLAVDTHVSRVAKRLALANEFDTAITIEKKLKELFPQDIWYKIHHQMLFFGRYKCLARNPQCDNCPFINQCIYNRFEEHN